MYVCMYVYTHVHTHRHIHRHRHRHTQTQIIITHTDTNTHIIGAGQVWIVKHNKLYNIFVRYVASYIA